MVRTTGGQAKAPSLTPPQGLYGAQRREAKLWQGFGCNLQAMDPSGFGSLESVDVPGCFQKGLQESRLGSGLRSQ